MKQASLWLSLLLLPVVLLPSAFGQSANSGDIRVGVIGLDTSHAALFTQYFNDPNSPQHVAGVRVVAGYVSGSDHPLSISNMAKFPAEMRDKWNVEIVKDIPTLLSKVDAVLLESLDGRVHLDQVKPLLKAGKPVFIDKPLAANYHDAREIARLAQDAGMSWWSSSSLRYNPILPPLKDIPGGVQGALTYGPAPLDPTNPGFFWYGIHATEMLYMLMGPGCEEVAEFHTEDADVVVGRWKDGRLGTVRGIRKGPNTYGALVFGNKTAQYSASGLGAANYPFLLKAIVQFFQTRVPPVPNSETLELMAFMEAAELSRKAGGVPVKLREVK